MLSGKIQTQKTTYFITPCTWKFRVDKSTETEYRLESSSIKQRVEWELTTNEYGVSFWADKNVLELESGESCTTL